MEITRLLGDLVLIEQHSSERFTDSGIEFRIDGGCEGTVVGVGPDVKVLQVGHDVRCLPHCGIEVILNSKRHLIANEFTEIDVIL